MADAGDAPRPGDLQVPPQDRRADPLAAMRGTYSPAHRDRPATRGVPVGLAVTDEIRPLAHHEGVPREVHVGDVPDPLQVLAHVLGVAHHVQLDGVEQGDDRIEIRLDRRARGVPGGQLHSPTAFFRGAAVFLPDFWAAVVFLAAVFLAGAAFFLEEAVVFFAADFRAGAGSLPACFFAAATLAFRASIRSTTLAVGSGATDSISWPLILASTICSSASRYPSVYSSGFHSAVRFSISCRAIWSSCSRTFTSRSTSRVERADLVGPVHGLQHERVVLEAKGGEVLLVAEAHLRDADLLILAQRLTQQRVRLRAGLVRDQVVGLLVQHGVDLVQVDELLDVDGPAGLDAARRRSPRR